MRPTLCDTFRSRALSTWDTLARGRSVDCQIGEETLTDLNILELKIRHPSEVYSQTFTKPKEGFNGADWEWWFTGSSGKWIGFRVQAKVIDIDTDSFKHLHYENKNSGFQCDHLIKDALSNKEFPMIPLYCLYSNWNILNKVPWRCLTYYPVEESYGCSILSAFAVHYLRSFKKSRTTSLKFLLNHINPWHCLVCCRGYGKGDLPNRVFTYWKNFLRQSEKEISEEFSFNIPVQVDSELENYYGTYKRIDLLDKPPKYVDDLLNKQLNEQPDRNELNEEYYPNARWLTIFRERDELT